ncbi:MAG: hypothetical protein R3Y51_04395 [Rikenellaceae bacterium]
MVRFIEYLALYILIVFLQMILFDNIQITGYLNIIIYPLFLILLPFNTNRIILLFLGAVLGLTADIISCSFGVYSIVFIFLGFVRPFLLRLFVKTDLEDSPAMPVSGVMGAASFLQYLFVIMFLTFVSVTFLERLTLDYLWVAMLKILVSTVVSSLIIYFLQLPLNKLNKNTWI